MSTKKLSLIQVSNPMKLEQYESAKSLITLLNLLEIPCAQDVLDEYVEEVGDQWELCECDSGEIKCECRCEDDGPRYSAYDDEASFD